MRFPSFQFRLCLSPLFHLGVLLLLSYRPELHAQERASGLLDAPAVRSQNHVAALTLHAVRGSDSRDSFSFNGKMTPPVIYVSPGDTLKIAYVNDLPPGGQCATGPCMNMTNLHFHGLGISPQAPQDDVLNMIAMPGQTLHYEVYIPPDQQPGLFWYHTHPHGESQRQVLDGMSGAVGVEGMERYVPALRGLPERGLILRGRSIENDADARALRAKVEVQAAGCGNPEAAERIFTVNGEIRPSIGIAPGERQFWRIVNASADSYADVQLDGETWKIVALDGMPLAYHNPERPLEEAKHVLLPPASRLEAIVPGPPAGSHSALRSLCVDTGPDGDPNPSMLLADIVPAASRPAAATASDRRPPVHRPLTLASPESRPPQFVAGFPADKNSFLINGGGYQPGGPPMTELPVGTH